MALLKTGDYMSFCLFEVFGKVKKVYKRKKYVKEKRKEHSREIKEIEDKFGVDFGGYIPDCAKLGTDSSYCNGYESSYPMPEILEYLNIKEGDKLLDVGSGKGYAIYVFSQFPFSALHGVELSESLADISRKNFSKLFPNDGRFKVFTENALTFSRLDDYNYIYLYNPFPREVIGQFVENLKQSVLRRGGEKITVIYQNPQKGALFEESGVFKKVLIKNGTAIFESIK